MDSGTTCSDRTTLLVLDNLEHLIETGPRLAELLAAAPQLTILATSRERLALAAEHEYAVPPLPVADAVELFVARARQLDPRFEPGDSVAEICLRLDRLPLALELVAARVKVLTPDQILSRLERPLDLLASGPRDLPERQRTLRNTIAWSYGLLDETERSLFARLAVFPGSFDLDAAEDIAAADLDQLQSLIDKSLLRHTQAGRFFMLETIQGLRGRAAQGNARERFHPAPARRSLPRARRASRSRVEGPESDGVARQVGCRARQLPLSLDLARGCR